MADCKFEITNSDGKVIAKAAREVALKFDPWGYFRPLLFAFALGGIFVAALDYGDVWICVGECSASPRSDNKPEDT
jgi:hypothetical protein